MTIVTGFAACDMRWGLTDGGDTIVAGAAVPQHLCVVYRKRRCPDIRVVAVLAYVSR